MPETKYDIFINYRRDDTQPMAVVLELLLRSAFDNLKVFLDQEGIQAEKWPDKIRDALAGSQLVITLVGSKWLSVKNKYEKRRIDEAGDWVRAEIEMAVEQGKTLLPLQVDNARLPEKEALEDWPLLQRWLEWNAEKIAWESFRSDFENLTRIIAEKLGKRPASGGGTKKHPLDVYPLPEGIDPFAHDEEDLELIKKDPAFAKKRPAPYLGLRYFRRKDAPLFFGRTPEILTFFGLVKSPGVRIIRLYGNSGVGKSSFLAAGVVARLELIRQPHYMRRNKVTGLGNQLQACREEQKKYEKHPVYILDQAEEMFTEPVPGETDFFVAALDRALREEPEATFVFGFRSDYLLELDDLLARVSGSREDLPLRPLSQSALAEAVEGVWLDKDLRDRYRFDLEAGFAEYVSRDLVGTETGGAASILQNRLLKLYTEAQKKRNPVVHLRISDYQQLKHDATAEAELLDFQLQRLRDEGLHDGADDQKILETLNRFVVDKPTAGTQLKEDLTGENSRLRDGLRRVNLLSEIPESQAIRLSHDLLAPIVRKRYNQLLLDENERLEIENVRLRLRKVRELLLDIKFMEAWTELLKAGKSNAVPEEIWPLAFEIAFILLQAGEKTEGEQALLICAGQMRNAGVLIPAFPDDTSPHRHDFPELLHFLRRCDPAGYIRLERRYFPVMRHIEGGAFDMGDVMGDKEYDEETVHRVELDTFELAETPLTWQQYGLFYFATGRKEEDLPNDSGWGRADRPVIDVSWYDAVEYCNWLSALKGLEMAMEGKKEDDDTYFIRLEVNGYRLPTEAEWEYAAREGGKKVRFGNGKDDADPVEINFDGSEPYKKDYSKVGEYRSKTTPVYQFAPNALGLHDMSGNVDEWCWDWYDENYYENSPEKNPVGPDTGSYRVIRGGAWNNDAFYCRVAFRYRNFPDNRYYGVGFRPARTVSL